MRKILLVIAVLSTSTAAAFAGEGNGDPFPFAATGPMVAAVPTSPTQETGTTPMWFKNPPNSLPDSQAAVASANRNYLYVGSTNGNVLPTNGSEGAVQTANSMPAGAEQGTAAHETAQAVARYWAQQQANQAARTAQVSPAARRGS
jgi:hypothetical protein